VAEKDDWKVLPDQYMKFKFVKREDGINVCVVTGLYGTNTYLYSPEELKKDLGGIITSFLWGVRSGSPIDFGASLAASNDQGQAVDVELHVDEEFVAEGELLVDRALELYRQHLPYALAESVDQHVEEIVYRVLKEYSGKGSFKFTGAERQIINTLVRRAATSLKRRVGARGPGGSEPEWTLERAEDLLTAYEEGLQMLKDAKQVYKQNKHRGDWKEYVRLAQQNLPEHLIDLLPTTDKNSEPGNLALRYAAEKMNVASGEYLKKILTKARKSRKIGQ
jgi:hypothetical protein